MKWALQIPTLCLSLSDIRKGLHRYCFTTLHPLIVSKDSAFIYYKKSSFDRRQQCDVGLCPVCGNSQTKEKQPPTQINQGAYSKSHIIIKCQSFEIHPLVSNVRMKSPLSASTRMSSLSIRVWYKQQFSVVFQLSHVAHSGSSSTVRYMVPPTQHICPALVFSSHTHWLFPFLFSIHKLLGLH